MSIGDQGIHLWFFWACGLIAVGVKLLSARRRSVAWAEIPYFSAFSDGVLVGLVLLTLPTCVITLVSKAEMTITIGGYDATVLFFAAIRAGSWLVGRLVAPRD